MPHPLYESIYGSWKEELSGAFFIFESRDAKVYIMQKNFSSFVYCYFEIISEEDKDFLIIESERFNLLEIIKEKRLTMKLLTDEGRTITLVKLDYI